MMRFISITNKLIEAIFEFCMEQMGEQESFNEYDVREMLDTTFDELDRIKGGVLPVSAIHSFHMTANGIGDILPDYIEDSGIISDNIVHLGTFVTDDYYSTVIPSKTVESGYEVVNDLNSDKVILLYRVLMSDSETSTLYRCKTDWWEDFNIAEFIISLAVQLAGKLRDSANYLEKVCDVPCV